MCNAVTSFKIFMLALKKRTSVESTISSDRTIFFLADVFFVRLIKLLLESFIDAGRRFIVDTFIISSVV
jgi:hypothetical protein